MAASTSEYAELVYLRRIVMKIPTTDMAKAIGVSTETYLRAERGEREFTLVEAMKISNKLNMPIALVFPKIFKHDVANYATS